MPFRILTYNIKAGGGGRVDRLARVVNACAPELVLLQEATTPEIIGQLADATGMAEWRASRKQSLGYMSRLPVVHASWHRPRVSRHAFIEVVPAGVDIRVFGVHLSAVHAAWTEHRRVYELRALLRAVAQHQHGFHVLAGDFNTLAPGALLDLARLPFRLRPLVWASGGRIKWRTVQTILDAGYVDAYRAHHPDEPGCTLPAADPYVRLDYVFVPRAFAHRVLDCNVVRHDDARRASDHLPVVIDLADVDPALHAKGRGGFMADTHRPGTLNDWTTEEEYWRTNFTDRPYVGVNRDFQHWQPAYRYGYESAQKHSGRSWADVESDLRTGWDRYEHRGAARSTWEQIKDAVKDGWERLTH